VAEVPLRRRQFARRCACGGAAAAAAGRRRSALGALGALGAPSALSAMRLAEVAPAACAEPAGLPSLPVRRGATVVELQLPKEGEQVVGWRLGAALRREARLVLAALALALLAGPLAVASEGAAQAALGLLTPNATRQPCSRFALDDRAVSLMVNVCVAAYLSQLGFLVASVHANGRVIKLAPHIVLTGAAATIGAVVAYAKSYEGKQRGLDAMQFEVAGVLAIYFAPHLTYCVSRLVTSREYRWARELRRLALGLCIAVFGLVLGASAVVYALLSNIVSGSTSLLINGE
jgi:hypothetical protein